MSFGHSFLPILHPVTVSWHASCHWKSHLTHEIIKKQIIVCIAHLKRVHKKNSWIKIEPCQTWPPVRAAVCRSPPHHSILPSLCFPLFRPNPLFWPSGQIFSSISPQCEVTQSAPITILVTEINNLVPLQLDWNWRGGEEGGLIFFSFFLCYPLFNPHLIFSLAMFPLLARIALG